MQITNFPQLMRYLFEEEEEPKFDISSLEATFGDTAAKKGLLGAEELHRLGTAPPSVLDPVKEQAAEEAKKQKEVKAVPLPQVAAKDPTVTVRLTPRFQDKKCASCGRKKAVFARVRPEQVTGTPTVFTHDVHELNVDPKTGQKSIRVVAKDVPHAKFFSYYGDDIWKTLNKSQSRTGAVSVTENDRIMHEASKLHTSALKAAGFATEEIFDKGNPEHQVRFNRALAWLRQQKTTARRGEKFVKQSRFLQGSGAEALEAQRLAGFGTNVEGARFDHNDPQHVARYQEAASELASKWKLTSGRPETHKIRHYTATDLGPDAVHSCSSPECLSKLGIDPHKAVLHQAELEPNRKSGVGHPGTHIVVSEHQIKKATPIPDDVKEVVFGINKETGKPNEPFVSQEYHDTPSAEQFTAGFRVAVPSNPEKPSERKLQPFVTAVDWMASQNAHTADVSSRELRKNLNKHYIETRAERGVPKAGTTGYGRGLSRYMPSHSDKSVTVPTGGPSSDIKAFDFVTRFQMQPPTTKHEREQNAETLIRREALRRAGGDKQKAASALKDLILKANTQFDVSKSELEKDTAEGTPIPPAPESEAAEKAIKKHGRKIRRAKKS